MHSAEENWRDLAAPLPSFADLVRVAAGGARAAAITSGCWLS
jgi:hypothetical protein